MLAEGQVPPSFTPLPAQVLRWCGWVHGAAAQTLVAAHSEAAVRMEWDPV